MVIDQTKFLTLSENGTILPCLKSYMDSVLFYYLGHLAIQHTKKDILEIGVGGSTHPLVELSGNTGSTFHVVDNNKTSLDTYTRKDLFPNAVLNKILIDSRELTSDQITPLGYIHVDGDKEYRTAKSDLEFSVDNLAPMGIICQDDYGNNKWPTIAMVTESLISKGNLKHLLVGDSSTWLVRPEDHDAWLEILDEDPEFRLLSSIFSLTRADYMLNSEQRYIFHNALFYSKHSVDEKSLTYFSFLVRNQTNNYLQMPYDRQTRIGSSYGKEKDYRYELSHIWNDVKGDDWPDVPLTKQDIESLPDWIKKELAESHGVEDIFKHRW